MNTSNTRVRISSGSPSVVESTFNWYRLVDLLQDHEVDVKLAHPLYLKAIASGCGNTAAGLRVDRVTFLEHPHQRPYHHPIHPLK